MGAAISEPTPRARPTSGSMRGSFSASSQETRRPLRTHSPDNPWFTSTGAPSGGAGSPVRARQIILSSVSSAKAAPVAPVRFKARPVMSCKTASTSSPISRSSRRTASTGEGDPLPSEMGTTLGDRMTGTDSRNLSSSRCASCSVRAAWLEQAISRLAKSHSFSICRELSGSAENRIPPRPASSLHITWPLP